MLSLSPLRDLEQIQAQGYAKLDNYFATGGTTPVVSSDLPIISNSSILAPIPCKTPITPSLLVCSLALSRLFYCLPDSSTAFWRMRAG
ncbi:hypothetical protein L2E82_44531 [Cichorium intybus]|uniref:Uncharacterized protein n=1 Tax=Cichorium intybus TaxID=13427 RepID=A0ACB8ZQP2_CICIN|nr:hypothetical protein L2E82_44531 [Cichorium intybus]